MRCYFMRDGHIVDVEPIEGARDDADAIDYGVRRFRIRVNENHEPLVGFEIWERTRFVYCFPTPTGKPTRPPHEPAPRGKPTRYTA